MKYLNPAKKNLLLIPLLISSALTGGCKNSDLTSDPASNISNSLNEEESKISHSSQDSVNSPKRSTEIVYEDDSDNRENTIITDGTDKNQEIEISEENEQSEEELEKTSQSILNKVVYDQNQIKITFKTIEMTAEEINMNIAIENQSTESYVFCSGLNYFSATSINNRMVPGGNLSEKINSGRSSDATISFKKSNLIEYGITDIQTVQLGIAIENLSEIIEDEFQLKPVYLDQPLSFFISSSQRSMPSLNEVCRTIADEKNETIIGENTDTLFENDNYKITSSILAQNQSGGLILYLVFSNENSQDVHVSMDDFLINGILIQADPTDSTIINQNSEGIIKLDFGQSIPPEIMTDSGLYPVFSIDSKLTVYSFDGIADSTYNNISLYHSESDSKNESTAPDSATKTEIQTDVGNKTDLETEAETKTETETKNGIQSESPAKSISNENSENILYDQNGLKITYAGMSQGKKFIYIGILVTNDTEEEIDFSLGDSYFDLNGDYHSLIHESVCIDRHQTCLLIGRTKRKSAASNDISGIDDITKISFDFKSSSLPSANEAIDITFDIPK